MPPSRKRLNSSDEQPELALDLPAAALPAARARRTRKASRVEAPIQLALEMETAAAPEPEVVALPSDPAHATHWQEPEAALRKLELPDFDPDPFAEIPGFLPAAPSGNEWVLLPGSLRGRLDLREFARFVGSLRTVARDWEGAPEIEDGGLRLRGLEGGAWVYPEASRVRVVTDGSVAGPVAEELIALCRWLETRAGLRLYPAGETNGAGTDRSIDPAEAFGT